MKQECVRDYEALIQLEQLHGLVLTQEQALQFVRQLVDVLKAGAQKVNIVVFNRSLYVAGE